MWTEAEERELQKIADSTLNGRRLRGWRDNPLGRLALFANKYGRSHDAVLKKAQRLKARSYVK